MIDEFLEGFIFFIQFRLACCLMQKIHAKLIKLSLQPFVEESLTWSLVNWSRQIILRITNQTRSVFGVYQSPLDSKWPSNFNHLKYDDDIFLPVVQIYIWSYNSAIAIPFMRQFLDDRCFVDWKSWQLCLWLYWNTRRWGRKFTQVGCVLWIQG